jgi:hypothetical protein
MPLRARKSKSTFSTTMNGHPAHVYEGVNFTTYAASAGKRSCITWAFFLERVRAQRVHRGQVLGSDSVMPGEWDCTFACVLREQAREAPCVVHPAAELHTKPFFETCWSANFILHTHSCELTVSTDFLGQPSEHCDHTRDLGSNFVLVSQRHN